MFVRSVQRINDQRWDTWVCVDVIHAIEYGSGNYCELTALKCVEREILEIVNNCKTDEFYNKNTGERTYSKAKYKCECADHPNCREHWIVTNKEDD